ncbi:MAG: DNA polymerase IV [Mycobacterium sp.]
MRWILHVDLDQFLASVELRRRPDLAGLPVIVGGQGDPTASRTVVTCASYEARGFGVHAGMPLRAAARRCPDAVFLPSDPPAYDAASTEVMDLLRDLGYPVEVWGWDEAYLSADTADPMALAEHIRAVVADATGLSCSVGISDNKQRAKVATGFAKPAGVRLLTDADWMDTVGHLPVDTLWGIGPKTTKRLAALDITTVRALADADAETLIATFGPRTGLWILLLAKGGGDTEVSTQPWVPRSRSHVVTFPDDLVDRDEMRTAVADLARRTLTEVSEQGRLVTHVAVTVRTATFHTRTKVRKLAAATVAEAAVVDGALDVFGLFDTNRPIRLLGVRLDLLMPGSDVD